MDHPRNPRGPFATLRAMMLAVAAVLAVATASAMPAGTDAQRRTLPSETPVGAVLAADEASPGLGSRRRSPLAGGPAGSPAAAAGPASVERPAVRAAGAEPVGARPKAVASGPSWPSRIAERREAPPSRPTPAPDAVPVPELDPAARNRLVIPSLGIDRPVHPFPCERRRPPGDLVYAWGCAGEGNAYLLGHAHSVFRPLHDAYVEGRLRLGMRAWHAGPDGRLREYRVAWWRVVRPVAGATWAWGGQEAPVLTLQTCVGADSERRLVVRLLAVDPAE